MLPQCYSVRWAARCSSPKLSKGIEQAQKYHLTATKASTRDAYIASAIELPGCLAVANSDGFSYDDRGMLLVHGLQRMYGRLDLIPTFF